MNFIRLYYVARIFLRAFRGRKRTRRETDKGKVLPFRHHV